MMHIPDGFVDAKTAIGGAVLSLTALGIALRQVRLRVAPVRIPLIGLGAAFVFAAQMLNFPVASGTSGHLLGAVLAMVLLGPSAAVLVMSAVIILQCLLFADGGFTALGVNLFNMAVVAPGFGYLVYAGMRQAGGGSLRAQLLATAFAAWCSTVASAMSCAGQLALSGTASWKLIFPAMVMIHMIIGVGEALLTTLVIAAIATTRPELLANNSQPQLQSKLWETVLAGMFVSLGFVMFLAPFACSWPDGLEFVANKLGFTGAAADRSVLASPLPDYSIPGLNSAVQGTMIAGAIGVVLAFLLAYLLARSLTPTSRGGKPVAAQRDHGQSQ